MQAPRLRISRKVEFSASHRLHRDDYSPEKNRRVFGKCSNPHGHGHNYELEVTLEGPVDPETGLVVHFDLLKALLQESVVEPLDHHNMNFDVPFLEGVIPSSENVVMRLWERIEAALGGGPVRLYRLRLKSSSRHEVEYYGPGRELP